MSSEQGLRVYFAGELFSLKHLLGNAALGAAIFESSAGRYCSILPQDLEQRETTAESIRNQDLKALLESDVALFNFDGDEVDSGTVIEYAYAKFCDIPSVIIRTDFRAKGDQELEPWNLMLSFYPRTKVIIADAMAIYQKHLAADSKNLKKSVTAGLSAIEEIAGEIVSALDEVVARPPLLTQEIRSEVYTWATKLAGESYQSLFEPGALEELIQRKSQRGVL